MQGVYIWISESIETVPDNCHAGFRCKRNANFSEFGLPTFFHIIEIDHKGVASLPHKSSMLW